MPGFEDLNSAVSGTLTLASGGFAAMVGAGACSVSSDDADLPESPHPANAMSVSRMGSNLNRATELYLDMVQPLTPNHEPVTLDPKPERRGLIRHDGECVLEHLPEGVDANAILPRRQLTAKLARLARGQHFP